MAANDMKWNYKTPVVLEASGGTAAAVGGFADANDASMTSANHGDYPLADLVLNCAFAAAIGASGSVNVYRQALNISGATHGPAPSATNKGLYVGSFQLTSGQSTNTANYQLNDVPLISQCQFTIENQASQNLSGGWAMTCTPKTYTPATS